MRRFAEAWPNSEIVQQLLHKVPWFHLCTVLDKVKAGLDAGTPESLLEASTYVQILEARQGLKIACPEEIAYRMHFIDRAQLERLAQPIASSPYGRYLLSVAAE